MHGWLPDEVLVVVGVVAGVLAGVVAVVVEVEGAVTVRVTTRVEPPEPPDPPQAASASASAQARVRERPIPLDSLLRPMILRSPPAGAYSRSLRHPCDDLALRMSEPSDHPEQRMRTSALRGRPRPHVLATLDRLSPYWGPQLVVLVAILLDLILPDDLTLGPHWVLPSIEGTLLIGLAGVSPHPSVRHHPRRREVALAMIGLVSAVNIFSLVRLCDKLINSGTFDKHNGPKILIASGAVLWLTNVLLFGLWYWQLDRGGPADREAQVDCAPDFMFPQMTDPRYAPPDWKPGLVDYLYTSFTNATAFSPTDTMPLSAVAKGLMSAQALTALVTVGLVVARAVNIL